MISLINNDRLHAGKKVLGFVNPAMYQNPQMFNDVETGYNSGCGATPAFNAAKGWDPVTGLGSPDYQRMRDVFMRLR